jgi:hypothetical protein
VQGRCGTLSESSGELFQIHVLPFEKTESKTTGNPFYNAFEGFGKTNRCSTSVLPLLLRTNAYDRKKMSDKIKIYNHDVFSTLSLHMFADGALKE